MGVPRNGKARRVQLTALRATITTSICLLLLAVLATAPARVAHAFDQVVHHSLVYAAAVANGFPPDEAAIIANGAYALDENDSTTAFSSSLLPAEFKDVLARVPLLVQGVTRQLPWEMINNLERLKLEELPHMRAGQVFHALTSPENRQMIQQAHLARINRVLTDANEPGTREQKRRRALLYLGQYLHFVGDTVVHPNEPLLGHGLDGHVPDRGDLNAHAVMMALSLFSREMGDFKSGRMTLRPLPATARDAARMPLPAQLGNSPAAHRILIQVAKAVEESWRKTYAADQGLCIKVRAVGSGPEKLGDILERERIARAASEVGRVLVRNNLTYRVFHNLKLDSDGEPIAYCRQPPHGDCDAATAEAMFGRSTRQSTLPFANTLADSSELVAERKRSVARLLAMLREAASGKHRQILETVVATQRLDHQMAGVIQLACQMKNAAQTALANPPQAAAPADLARLRMSTANLDATVGQALERQQSARDHLLAAARETDPAQREVRRKEAGRALDSRDGLLVTVARQTAVPLAPPQRQGSALPFGNSPTLELLKRMDRQYKDQGGTNPLGAFVEHYDGDARKAAGALNVNPGTQFFGIPTATRGALQAIPPPPPPPVHPGTREPGGIKFSSARAADIAGTLDITSIAFDAARGRIVISGTQGAQTFDIDVFADVLRLAIEEDEPFFSLDAVDPAAWDGMGERAMAEVDKSYPTADRLLDAVRRASPPPLVRGNRTYYYTTVEALDPELARRAHAGKDISTRLVFSPAWLRYSKVGQILYEADLAIKAVATGFVEQDGAIIPMNEILKLPDFDPIWAQPGSPGAAGRANFELSPARVERSVGRIDLSKVRPHLYATQRAPGTDRDLKPTPREEALARHFDQHWRAYAQSVPEIGRLVSLFRAYVAARFLAEHHPGLKARILALPRELPPAQPPVLIVNPLVIRVAVEGSRYIISYHGGYGGGIDFGVAKKSADGSPRIDVTPTAAPTASWWQGLATAAWYDGRTDAVRGPQDAAFALDFEGGDMPLSWHLRLVAIVAVMALAGAGMALVLRRGDWQRIEITQACGHCGVVHSRLGRAVAAADVVAAASLGYLALLPLVASAYEASSPDWREVGLSAGLVLVLVAALILLGLLQRGLVELLRPQAPRSGGLLTAAFAGARLAGLGVAAFIFHAGVDPGAVGATVATALTSTVAERTFAMGGGTMPVTVVTALAGISAITAFACRWLLPYLLRSRPLALFSFAHERHRYAA